MNFSEQLTYINRSISAGKVFARGNPIKPQSHEGHPDREVLGITFQLGSKQINTVLRVWAHQATTSEDLDPLCNNIEQLIHQWGDD